MLPLQSMQMTPTATILALTADAQRTRPSICILQLARCRRQLTVQQQYDLLPTDLYCKHLCKTNTAVHLCTANIEHNRNMLSITASSTWSKTQPCRHTLQICHARLQYAAMAFENQQDSHFSGSVKQALSPSLCLKTGCQLSFTIHYSLNAGSHTSSCCCCHMPTLMISHTVNPNSALQAGHGGKPLFLP